MSTKKYIMSHREVASRAGSLINALMLASNGKAYVAVYPVPRGGVPAAYMVAAAVQMDIRIVENPGAADVILDDIIDSGATMQRYCDEYPGKPFLALVDKLSSPGTDAALGWVVFPWESVEEGGHTTAEDNVRRMLQVIGEDPSREGLQDTPERVVRAWKTWFGGYGKDPASVMKVFADGAEGCDEMVTVRAPVYSHCEHHIAPIVGGATVSYIPDGKIIGLSKIVRLVDMFSRRLQVQERLTNQIADAMQEHLNPLGVAVSITAEHLCMTTRGVQAPNGNTTTQALRGVFKDNPETRAEFMGMIK